jgi:hypothetical protein
MRLPPDLGKISTQTVPGNTAARMSLVNKNSSFDSWVVIHHPLRLFDASIEEPHAVYLAAI